MLKKILALSLIVAVTPNLWAAEDSLKVQELKSSLRQELGNKKFNPDADITDIKIKAESGSLSRYSLKTSLTYYGSSLSTPFAKEQPNLDNSPRDHLTSLSGSISGRYRVSGKTAFSLGSGLSALTPFQGIQRFDLNSPYLAVDHTYKALGFEMRTGLSTSLTTTPDYKKYGQVGSLGLSHSMVYNFQKNKFGVGLESSLQNFIYSRGYDPKIEGKKKVSNYYAAVYPFLKYKMTDKVNVKTSTSYSFQNLRRDEQYTTWTQGLVSQRLELGIAFTREIYIAPYLDFYPDNLKADTTTVSVATIFSIF